MTPGAGRAFKGEDGSTHPDHRRMSPGQHLDRFVSWVILGLLGWLCITATTLQQQMATVVERTTNTQQQMGDLKGQINRESDDRKAADQTLLELVNAKTRR